uniref:GDP/GTP exchange factor Sec2 N-terminal domain-containing protein n=1 Tax=Mycena chlorophos TaxID=658473 RepID=A0ABQ0M5Y1_MYCCL|nr:predicted protein [Mycena chlorophos]
MAGTGIHPLFYSSYAAIPRDQPYGDLLAPSSDADLPSDANASQYKLALETFRRRDAAHKANSLEFEAADQSQQPEESQLPASKPTVDASSDDELPSPTDMENQAFGFAPSGDPAVDRLRAAKIRERELEAIDLRCEVQKLQLHLEERDATVRRLLLAVATLEDDKSALEEDLAIEKKVAAKSRKALKALKKTIAAAARSAGESGGAVQLPQFIFIE